MSKIESVAVGDQSTKGKRVEKAHEVLGPPPEFPDAKVSTLSAEVQRAESEGRTRFGDPFQAIEGQPGIFNHRIEPGAGADRCGSFTGRGICGGRVGKNRICETCKEDFNAKPLGGVNGPVLTRGM